MADDDAPPARLADIFRAVAARAGYHDDRLAEAFIAGSLGAGSGLDLMRLGAEPVPRDEAESDALSARYGLASPFLWWLVRDERRRKADLGRRG